MLTERQAAVAALVARGLPDKLIAAELGVSTNTVDYHLREIAKRIPGGGKPRHKCTVWFFTLLDEDYAESA